MFSEWDTSALLCSRQEYAQDEDRDLSLANQLGLLMSYHLHAVQHIDQLLEYSNKGMYSSQPAWPGCIGFALYVCVFVSVCPFVRPGPRSAFKMIETAQTHLKTRAGYAGHEIQPCWWPPQGCVLITSTF